MIRLQGDHSVAAVEAHLTRLAVAPADEALLLPTKLRERHYLGLPVVIQLIATWRDRCPKGELRIHVQARDEDAQTEAVLQNFVDTDHGLVATALAPRITDVSGSRDLTAQTRALMAARLGTMTDFESISHGPKIFAVCLDRSPHAAPAVLYLQPVVRPLEVPQRDPELLDTESFARLAGKIDDRLWGTTREGRVSVRDSAALAGILRELMRNTQDWARRDETEAPYGPHRSVRGFRIEAHTVDPTHGETALLEGPLARYFSHPRIASRGGHRRFVELAVFDSGPGLASRFLRERLGDQPATREVEEEETRNCIRKRMSSSKEGHRGQGLAEVVRLANDAHGFVRLRSGRLSLFRDYLASPWAADPDDAAQLSHWDSDERLPHVAGTSIVAIFPVGHV